MSWVAIEGYIGRYAVSDDGEVMSMNFAKTGVPGILKKSPQRGYLSVELFDQHGKNKRITVHRLVAAAFIGPRPPGYQVNHKDGDKKNNRASNLEYVTASENIRHSFAIGLQSNQGEKHSQAKLKEPDVLRIRELLALGLTQAEVARSYGITPSAVSRIKSGELWPHVQFNAGAAVGNTVCVA